VPRGGPGLVRQAWADLRKAGSRLHGAGEEGVPFREIAEAIGRQLNLPAVAFDAVSWAVPLDIGRISVR